MTNKEAVNWLINLIADIEKSEHHDLWHYEQALDEIKEMLEGKDTNVPSNNILRHPSCKNRTSIGNCDPVGGFCSSVPKDICAKYYVTDTDVGDTISRQAAIDGKISIQRTNGVEMYSDEVVPVEYLKALPPARIKYDDEWRRKHYEASYSQGFVDGYKVCERPKGYMKIKVISAVDGEDLFCENCDAYCLSPSYNFCPKCGVEFIGVRGEQE